MKKVEQTKAKKNKKEKTKRLHEKKQYIDFILTILTIPSVLLFIIINFRNLVTPNDAKPTPMPTTGIFRSGTHPNFFSIPITKEPTLTLQPSQTQAPCVKGLGPVSITSPNEGAKIATNPVEIDVSYDDSTHCSAVWSYSINNSSWSDYNNASIALYNLPNGPIQIQLRVKSLTNSDTTTITRNFTYTGSSNAPTPIASSSAQQ